MLSPRFSIETVVSSFGKDGSREHSASLTMCLSLKNIFFKMSSDFSKILCSYAFENSRPDFFF